MHELYVQFQMHHSRKDLLRMQASLQTQDHSFLPPCKISHFQEEEHCHQEVKPPTFLPLDQYSHLLLQPVRRYKQITEDSQILVTIHKY